MENQFSVFLYDMVLLKYLTSCQPSKKFENPYKCVEKPEPEIVFIIVTPLIFHGVGFACEWKYLVFRTGW